MNPTLRDYIEELERESPEEVLRIKEEIEADFVPTCLALKLEQQGKTPVLFLERIRGKGTPLITNIFASRSRVSKLIDTPLKGRSALPRIPPVLLSDSHTELDRQIFRDHFDEVVGTLPAGKHFVADGGPYITAGIIGVTDPETGIYNLSFHRLQIKTGGKLGFTLAIGGHLWQYLNHAAKRSMEYLDAVILLGVHPAIMVAAATRGVNEYEVAGGLWGRPVELRPADLVAVPVPLGTEVVIEGRIPVNKREPEGPFSEYSGYVSHRSSNHIFEIRSVSIRENPFMISVVAGNSLDHIILTKALKERSNLYRLQELFPEVRKLHYPESAVGFHGYLSMEKAAEGRAEQAMLFLLGLDLKVRTLIAFDPDIDLENPEQISWAVATRVKAEQDIRIIPGVFSEALDPCSENSVGTKVLVDATQTIDEEMEVCKVDPEAWREADAVLKARRGGN